MLNKVKKYILPMLDTLGDALTQYLAEPTEGFLDEITQLINAINTTVEDECADVIALSKQLRSSLKNPILAEVEQFYNEYCSEIENLPIQYKVVFLPYYDNTWDSLASVYEAFAADPMFVAEIVIIPIRRNTPTGWTMVYEDYLTPKGIPNTPFSDYSFENDLPDFVFYNNPYDGVNIEKFQSHNIKPYGGYMVYVPYFLYRHSYQNKEGIKRLIEQFTQLSGHNNADAIIVQGKSFLKSFAHRSRNGKKMVMLGNPKTDNIYKHMQDYLRYPEWDKATQGKTVFLLNTHYSSVVTGGYKDFLLYILKIIENNDDLALIWRPHPQSFIMFGADDKSEKYLEWQSYLERIGNHERMVLDETASDISAIMYSDAVISHHSSIVAEAIFADKPIFIYGMSEKEKVSLDMFYRMTAEDCMEKVKQARKYDVKSLFLNDAVCYIGLERIVTKEEMTFKCMAEASLRDFIDNIRNGIDSKKELRSFYREQLFVNRDGTCGQKIHDYIVGCITD